MAKATLILGHYYHETFVRDFSLLFETWTCKYFFYPRIDGVLSPLGCPE